MSTPEGLAVVDKPAGWTSHDVVARSRKLLGTRKVGHSGTLDPDATGVLLLGVGKATRLLRYLNHLPKTYVGDFVLGTETDTLDAAGEVTATHDMSAVTPDQVLAAIPPFIGAIEQIPPMVSAVKIDGKRLHQLAREGKEVDRPPRSVTVHRFEVFPIEGEPLAYRFEVECSSGTYVRTLAADVGHALGGGAHLRTLRRTAIGPYTVDDQAVALDDLTAEDLLPPSAAVPGLVPVTVSDSVAVDVTYGKVLPIETFFPEASPVAPDAGSAVPDASSGVPDASSGVPDAISGVPDEWAVFDGSGRLLATYLRHRGGTAKPSVVMVAAGQ